MAVANIIQFLGKTPSRIGERMRPSPGNVCHWGHAKQIGKTYFYGACDGLTLFGEWAKYRKGLRLLAVGLENDGIVGKFDIMHVSYQPINARGGMIYFKGEKFTVNAVFAYFIKIMGNFRFVPYFGRLNPNRETMDYLLSKMTHVVLM